MSPKGKRKSWYSKHKAKWSVCTRCPLHKRAKNYVIARGKLPADVVFIGEAPGKDENTMGRPFIGRAGQILNRMIEDCLQDVGNFDYLITNIVACIPWDGEGGVRPPTSEEAEACAPRLKELISRANPRLVVLLGKTAEEFGLPLVADTYECVSIAHPAWIARQGGVKSTAYHRELLKLQTATAAIMD